MMNNDLLKIKTQKALCKIISLLKLKKVKIRLICGCFDILHIGHLRLFKFAKSRVDILILGLDNDLSVRKTKGDNRPIHPQSIRMELLAGLTVVDYVFPINFTGKFGNESSYLFWKKFLKTIQPYTLFTCSIVDKFSDSKEHIASEFQIEFHQYTNLYNISTSAIEKVYF